MRHGHLAIVALALGGLASTVAASDGPSPSSKTVDEVLTAMDNTWTWGHPDQANEFSGMHAYHAGRYDEALADFKEAARYADKLSQLSIGLMYLNGQGVKKDPVMAFAWVAIAAERKYPQFLATRDSIWGTLDTAQRAQARVLIEQLYAQYGDATAKPRMAKVLRRNRTELTGSYLGFGSSMVESMTLAQFGLSTGLVMATAGRPFPTCGAETIDGAPMLGCGNIYVDWLWDPKIYFRTRDGSWMGTVTVGALQNAGDGSHASGDKTGHP